MTNCDAKDMVIVFGVVVSMGVSGRAGASGGVMDSARQRGK